MTLRKAVFEITADAAGMGYDDVHLPINTGSRLAQIERVIVDRSACYGDPNITITERPEFDDDMTSETNTFGRQLVYLERGVMPTSLDAGELVASYDVRQPVLSALGETPSSAQYQARETMKENDVRCEVSLANSGDVVTVTLVYETAGDYRF